MRHRDSFHDAEILVTGGAGFIGTNLLEQLLKDAPSRVVVVDNLLSAEHTPVLDQPGISFVEGSIADDDILSDLGLVDFDFVFHLATFHGNQNSIHDPLADADNNLLTTIKLFESLHRSTRLTKVVYASAGCTVAEKGATTAAATLETAPISLYHDSPYQISKIVGELYANFYLTQYGLPVVKARFQNVYGPGEILGAGAWRGTPATVWRNVVPTFIYRGLSGMPLVIDNGGQATRDFIFVDDIVDGLLRCALRADPGEVFNLASGVETSIAELAELVNRLTGGRSEIVSGPIRSWDHSMKRFGSAAKSAAVLGFVARTPLSEGLDRTVQWTIANLRRIECAIDRHAEHMGSPSTA